MSARASIPALISEDRAMTAAAEPPVILRCPRCAATVVLAVAGVATCLPCARRMLPVGLSDGQ